MTKIFKHHKPNIQAEYDPAMFFWAWWYVVRFWDKRSWKYLEADEQELLALWFEEIVPEARHFWNWMISWWDWCYINTTKTIKQYHRYETVDWDILSGCIDWSIFQTKEQAQNFDKMMMTVWKIWKWKKENDDGHIDRSDRDLKKYSLSYDFDGCFLWIYGIFTCYDFILPRFTSKEKVIQLISDLWEEELNNLLCWIK